jgi:hypothetical protein
MVANGFKNPTPQISSSTRKLQEGIPGNGGMFKSPGKSQNAHPRFSLHVPTLRSVENPMGLM